MNARVTVATVAVLVAYPLSCGRRAGCRVVEEHRETIASGLCRPVLMLLQLYSTQILPVRQFPVVEVHVPYFRASPGTTQVVLRGITRSWQRTHVLPTKYV